MFRRFLAVLLLFCVLCPLCPALAQQSSFAQTPLGLSSANKVHNLCTAAQALSGWVVLSGETFSFNEAVGPRTAEEGYLNAENGRGAKVRGGGVAQVATTLYLAVRELDDIVIEEFRTYGSRFTDGYVSDPADSVLVDYKAGTDFSFTNFGPALCISMWVDEAGVNCSVDPTASPWGMTYIASASTVADGAKARRKNISLASSSIDGVVVWPGEEFSFNSVVGPRTSEMGYQNAVNGRGVKVRGGGVAQVASTLYMAVKQVEGLVVTEKSLYGDRYNQSYVSDPADAIVTDYGAGTDFAFRNETDEPLVISMTVDASDILHCELYADATLWDDAFADGDDWFFDGDGEWVLDENGEWVWQDAWDWIG